MMRFVFFLILALLFPLAASAADATVYSILYLTKDYKTPPPLSLLKKEWTDEGLKGAEFSAKDGDLAGRLFKKSYVVVPAYLTENEAISALSERDYLSQYPFIVADLHRDDLLALAVLPETQQTVIFNIREKDDTLRTDTCLQNVFHLIPSRAMYADALGQYLKWKRWQKWFLVQGKQPADRLFATALTRTADRYGADIVETRDYQFEAGNRRMETGHQQIQTQIPMATQGAPDHDVLVVADESEAFGLYLGYRSKSPRPVVGTQGMFPTAWHRSFEQYGAARLQKIYEPSRAEA
ncbi:ABC transporter substrate-binding protein [Enterovibrio coralii]|uniref:Leucine-binding protein domain-containing protein n=1 Tax=Enterovibrio coralii TaxID=294935 RepID=A0A135IA64_9GAMM|nr:ABC transporter substrate-binding protein [Enterovibrio coralii]KXF82339.1 hypothetical protein ATN88_09270 [Enterovibrio coralii]